MPCSACLAFHGVNPNLKRNMRKMLKIYDVIIGPGFLGITLASHVDIVSAFGLYLMLKGSKML